MKTNRKTMLRRLALSVPATAVAVLLLGAGGCSYHNNSLPYLGKVQEADQQSLNSQEQTRFWSQVRLTSSLAGSHYKLGRYYQQSGKHEQAVSEFNKALRLDPQLVKAYNGLGISLTTLERCEQAEKAFRTGLVKGDKPAWLYNNFAYSSMLCGKPERAVTLLRYANELDRQNHRISNNLRLAELRHEVALAAKSEEPQRPVAREPAPPLELSLIYPSPSMQNKHTQPPEPSITDKQTAIPMLAAEKAKKTGSSIIHRQNLKVMEACGIEVSNGNGVSGMANRSADFFRSAGFAVNRITNADSFTYGSSMIFYRNGYRTVAEAVALTMPGEQHFEEVTDLGRQGIQVRVLLGRDMASNNFPATAAYQFNNDQHGLAVLWPATTPK